MKRLLLQALAAGCIVSQSAILTAQTKSIVLAGSAACTLCSIERVPLVRLGTTDGPGSLESNNSRAVRDSRGNFFVARSYGSEIKIFDASGRFIKSLGAKGGGPGEFKAVSKIHITRGDTIHVYDGELSRHSIFAPSFKFVRSVQWETPPAFIQGVTLADGGALVNINIRTPDRVGLPLHLVSANGKIIRSFGSETGVDRPDIPELSSRAIAMAGRGEVWVAQRTRYVLDLIDVSTGTVKKRIERKVNWFPPTDFPRSRPTDPVQPPATRIAEIHVDSTGLIWLLIGLPDARWKSAVEADPNNKDHIKVLDPAKYRDVMIEVIDPIRAIVVASIRYDDSPGWFIADGIAQVVAESSDGSPQIQIDRWQLKFPSKPTPR